MRCSQDFPSKTDLIASEGHVNFVTDFSSRLTAPLSAVSHSSTTHWELDCGEMTCVQAEGISAAVHGPEAAAHRSLSPAASSGEEYTAEHPQILDNSPGRYYEEGQVESYTAAGQPHSYSQVRCVIRVDGSQMQCSTAPLLRPRSLLTSKSVSVLS